MSATLQMIDTPAKRKSRGGWVYEAKFYYAGTDPESVMPSIGDKVEWGPGNGLNKVIDQPRADPLGTSAYLVYVTASSDSDDGTTTDPKSKEDFAKTVKKRMTLKEVRLDPKWWGIMVADKVKAGLTAFDKHDDPGNSKKKWERCYWFPRVDSTSQTKIMANEGDFIFKNAHPQLWLKWTDSGKTPGTEGYDGDEYQKFLNRSMDVGSTQTNLSPYVGPADVNVKFAGMPVKTFVYQCTFYTRNKFNNIGMFAGINGSFGAGCAPFDSAAARWLALDQTVEDVKDSDGDLWAQITRTMELAIGSWTWNPNKIVHGTWTW